ncbi:hypothetical protein F5890DRAFT_1559305 [Lentinula detonsa]|uniref:Uncharacterized protein n=1 Tax=Lentinula detonsa TaxID=2804962 RepID=A0AA38PPN3_9AGAR|nr:hypothetical protein F5890DRAFT_1559305 [Lentinula detonsa]
MDVLTLPLVGTQTICQHIQLHYGEHDPFLVAQPFDIRTVYLAMIRYPHSSDSTTTILWDLLDESKFEPIIDQKLADDPLDKFPNHYVKQLDQYYQTVHSSHSQLAHTQGMSDHWAKSRIEEYSYGIRYLLAKLDSPMLSTMHLTVFQGTVGDLNRYKVMGEYIWKQALPCFIWGSDNDIAKVKFDSPKDGFIVTRTAPTYLHSTSQAAGPSRSMAPPIPWPRRPSNCIHTKSSSKAGILSWAKASECIRQQFNHSQAGWPNVNQGYVLPEPALFVTQKDDATSQHFFANYLHVQKALLYCIDKCGILNALLSPAQWRTLLGLNLHDSDSSSGTTGAAQR